MLFVESPISYNTVRIGFVGWQEDLVEVNFQIPIMEVISAML
jgi:hypothetical protein